MRICAPAVRSPGWEGAKIRFCSVLLVYVHVRALPDNPENVRLGSTWLLLLVESTVASATVLDEGLVVAPLAHPWSSAGVVATFSIGGYYIPAGLAYQAA